MNGEDALVGSHVFSSVTYNFDRYSDANCHFTTNKNCLSIADNSNNNEYSNGHELIVRINGTSSDVFRIYCNITDVCRIDCQSQTACSLMYLYCFGQCFVKCGAINDVECPFAMYGNYSSWQNNTNTYTHSTTYPTNNQSVSSTISISSTKNFIIDINTTFTNFDSHYRGHRLNQGWNIAIIIVQHLLLLLIAI